MPNRQKPYILGIDLGVQSAGWGVIDLDDNLRPCAIRRCGVRCFDSGVGSESAIASGKDESQNVKRRAARLARRQLWRRGRRLKKVFKTLQQAGLLPPDPCKTPEERHELIKKLDTELAKQYVPAGDRVAAHLLPYRLRALALDQALPPFAFGRALFHLAQRRGFQTNSRSAAKNEKETGPVKKAIGELGEKMVNAKARTLGEYFAALDPEEHRIRGPKAWTARRMYADEFEMIWNAQISHNPSLDLVWKECIRTGIFHQRPLKPQDHLIGSCELEPDCRRAPWASLEAQRFRCLQTVNNLEVSTPDGDVWRLIDPQHADLRQSAIELLDTYPEMTFKSLRSKLGLKRPERCERDYRFNFETGEKRLKVDASVAKLRKALGEDCLHRIDEVRIATPLGEVWGLADPEHAGVREKLLQALTEKSTQQSLRSVLELVNPRGAKKDYVLLIDSGAEKKIKGNATAAKLRKILAHDLEKLSAEQLTAIVDDLVDYENRDALAERLNSRYGIAPTKAVALAEETLEDGHASFSRKAISTLLPILESGIRLASLKDADWDRLFPNRRKRANQHDFLPPILEVEPLRNPVVCRGLTELRKVVNALIREYGKPMRVRIELARDLKRSRTQREAISEQNETNRYLRDAARRKIARRMAREEDSISNFDVLKVRLAEECNWECPYTGKTIPMEDLVGPNPQFDVEHIIPFSRSMDNSFLNKTLCHIDENRGVKRKQTPYEAYSSDETGYHAILARVRRFRGSAAHQKLRKFQQKELDADFSARMLQDTRYMSKLAMEYLGLLYGGPIDGDGRRRVQSSAGRITGYLRDEWGMNAILADGDDEKNRGDHRHHAVDAVVIALTDASTVELLSRSAAQAEEQGHRLFVAVDTPWDSFLDDVRMAIDAVNISYRVNRRVTGALHEETNYSKPHKVTDARGRTSEFYHVRKPLSAMTAGMIEAIVDQRVREAVQQKVSQLGGFRKGMFVDSANHPYLRSHDARIIPIHKARIQLKKDMVLVLGINQRERRTDQGRNHHMEILAVCDSTGKDVRWDCKAVSLFDAHERVRLKQPVISQDHGADAQFLFSIAINEYVEMDDGESGRALYRVVSVWQERAEFRLNTDARPSTIIGKRITRSPEQLRQCNARKVVVDPLGNILPAND